MTGFCIVIFFQLVSLADGGILPESQSSSGLITEENGMDILVYAQSSESDNIYCLFESC